MSNPVKEKKSILRSDGFQSLLASLICIVLGLLIGFIVLLFINPSGAAGAIVTIREILPSVKDDFVV